MSTPRRRRAASDRVSAVNYNKRERFYYANIGQVVAALLPPRVPTAAARRNLQPDEICNLRNLDGLQPRLTGTGAGTTPEGFGRTVGL